MTGYQEMLTDPSFAGQIVVPTYPLQGQIMASMKATWSPGRIQGGRRSSCAGHSSTPSHALSDRTLHDYLHSQGQYPA